MSILIKLVNGGHNQIHDCYDTILTTNLVLHSNNVLLNVCI